MKQTATFVLFTRLSLLLIAKARKHKPDNAGLHIVIDPLDMKQKEKTFLIQSNAKQKRARLTKYNLRH